MAEAIQPAAIDRQRSPGFPSIDLKQAVEKIKVIYDADKSVPMPPQVIAGHLDQKHTSSTFQRTLAALKRFGLLVDAGSRNLRVSPAAVDILLMPEENPEKQKRIQTAALTPRTHRDLWDEYKTDLPSDATLTHKLVTEQGFQRESVADFIAEYKATLAFAKLTGDDKITDNATRNPPKVGDFVQWESQGMLQFPEPKRVVDISNDGTHLRVEGSMTGIPVEQTRVEQPPRGVAPAIPPNMQPPQRQPGYIPPTFSQFGQPKQDVFTTETGEVIVRWPSILSADEFEDLQGWLDMLKRKIKRSVESFDVREGLSKEQAENLAAWLNTNAVRNTVFRASVGLDLSGTWGVRFPSSAAGLVQQWESDNAS